ncbi:MAG: RluA family pseudouridine synthase [Candidatus Taylorbacteria bacterium]|nr:RluA family pseudouridine synthase [Candidatus Taylorbacteria bacterium]
MGKEQITVIYEDKDYVVINKPPGVIVHPDGKREGGEYVTDWFLEHYPKSKNVGEPIEQTDGSTIHRPGVVHRIDKDTSGVLVLAKTNKAHAFLKEQFQNRTVRKKYLTFVHGELNEAFGIIKRPIGRSKNDFRKWSAQRGIRGETREAETWYSTIKATKIASFLEVEPKTGRTHQIRVHFTAINHQIIADSLYGPNRTSLLGFERMALHASMISFFNPTGKEIVVKAPLPADFIAAAKEIEVPEAKLKDLLK